MSFKTNLISPGLPEQQGKNYSQQPHAHYRLIHVKQHLASASQIGATERPYQKTRKIRHIKCTPTLFSCFCWSLLL
ncbi:uncharacterized protein METZ01_LOCUS263582, partial [marine metagenome]